MNTAPAELPEGVMQPAILGHGGRWLVDTRGVRGPFGVVLHWTIEDLDSEEPGVAAEGDVLDLSSLRHEVDTALLGPDGLARRH